MKATAHTDLLLPFLSLSSISQHSFDLEAKQQDVDRLKRRVRELEAAYKHAVAVTGSSDVKGLGLKNVWGDDEGFGSGVRGKRERDLEGVVEAMKKVVDKLKSENDRLRKGVGVTTSTAGVEAKGEDLPRLAAEKKKAEKLEEDLRSVHGKLKTLEDSGQRLAQKQQQLTSLRKQLKGKEEELAATKETLDAVAAEKEALRRKSAASEGRVQQLEVAVQQARQLSKAPQGAGTPSKDRELKEITELKKKAAEDRDDNALLRSQLYDLESNLRDLERSGLEDSRARGDMSAPEAKRLKEENEKLRQELSAFDLDFFEEIENLKYAHSEAVKKLRVYEGGRDNDGYSGRQR